MVLSPLHLLRRLHSFLLHLHRLRDRHISLLQLLVNLHAHAPGHAERGAAGDDVDDVGREAGGVADVTPDGDGHEARETIAADRHQLEAVAGSDDLVVGGIRPELALLHEEGPRDRERERRAKNALAAVPHNIGPPAARNAERAGAEPLAALVLLSGGFEDGVASAAGRHARDRKKGGGAARAGRAAGRLGERDRDLVGVLEVGEEEGGGGLFGGGF